MPLNPWNTNNALSYIPTGTTDTDMLYMKARTMFITTIYIFEALFIWTFRRPNKSLYKSLKDEISYTLLIICLFTLALHVLFICFSYTVNYYVNDVFGLDLNKHDLGNEGK